MQEMTQPDRIRRRAFLSRSPRVAMMLLRLADELDAAFHGTGAF
jgi:hypothetical protein